MKPRVLVQRFFFQPLIKFVFGLNILGRENLKELPQFILISNHNSHLDTLILLSALPCHKIQNTHPLAAKEYFSRNKLLFNFMNWLLQPVWVDRENPADALAEMQTLIEKGHNLILFPEGSRGEAGVITEFKSGIGRLASNNPDLAIVPAYLEGPERSFPKGTSFPIPLCNHLTISPARLLTGNPQSITEHLHEELMTLAHEEQSARQQRPVPHSKPVHVAILGIDGSGKSTLSRMLAELETQSCCLVSDSIQNYKNGKPCDTQPLLLDSVRKWAGKKAKQAKSLKSYKIPKLTELILRDKLLSDINRWYRPDAVYLDGAPLLNMTAWAVLYKEQFFNRETCIKIIDALTGVSIKKRDPIFKQFPELKTLRKIGNLHKPDVMIFLDVPAEVCISRIESRGEDKQVHETTEKLTRPRDAYLLICDVLAEQAHIIDGNRPLVDVVADATKVVRNEN
jgi:1-acyl-sn-glycerol-3-phosphate acyltransferase